MAWVHVDRADVNNVDIFAFINLEQNVVMKGRVVVGSDLTTKVLVMCDSGEIQGMVPLPQWAYYSTQEALLKAFYEEVGKMPGADFQNKIWNMKHKNFTPEQYEKLLERLSDIAFETPKAIILKYVPDLSLSDEMLENFKF
jgi:hypothetical protein